MNKFVIYRVVQKTAQS